MSIVPLLAVAACRAEVTNVSAPGKAEGKPAVGDRDYTEATKSALFALSATCYYPECNQPSVKFFGEDPDKNVHVAHICAVKRGGARYDHSMGQSERDSFANFILLYKYHHGKVDKKANENLYPVDMLRGWKRDAEKDLRAKVDGLDRLTVAPPLRRFDRSLCGVTASAPWLAPQSRSHSACGRAKHSDCTGPTSTWTPER